MKAKKLGAGWRINKSDLQEFMEVDDRTVSIPMKTATELVADLRLASELIQARMEDQKELASRLSAYANWLAEPDNET